MKKKRHYRRYLPAAVAATFIAVVGLGVVYLIKSYMLAEPMKLKRTVQTISLLTPPPPPPRLEEPPPEPEMQEPTDIPEPEAMEDLPDMPGEDELVGEALGLDAEGGAGSDGFGLIGRKGGRGLLAGGHNPFGWFTDQLVMDIHTYLFEEKKEVLKKNYVVAVRLWVAQNGSITRAELEGSTGHPSIDDSIISAIESMPGLAQAPPLEMPQPIRIKITSRL